MPSPRSLALLLRAAQHAAFITLAALISSAALAQSAAPDPLRADQSAPLTYRSAFDGYRSFRAEELPPWQSVNDTVRSVGGHTGSVRESGEKPSSPASAAAPEAPVPKAMPSTPVQTEEPSHGRKH